ncbi:ribonuclease J [Limibaculum sp. M0105]|uniref:Ribonuclease J n=1 Tax=Thermohalobaculum xanthum TaxID=2753746 RepID=A0A8J7M4Z7_9RHOB|nr:ribonuclease J [Thermohalobaculum xanthum]MBK0397792.1 ribonuclease J [Thermohalobaculum xanthum]
MKDISAGPLVYVALGGAGEIGMNCYMYGVGEGSARRWIIVDLGIGFGDMETAPGVELVLPDITFAVEERSRIDAIFLTHGHEDHIGALPHLWPKLKVPVYARPFTAELARRKLADLGLDPSIVREVELGEHTEAGPFSVEYLNVTHSIPEASMLAIRTSAGLAVHSGDFKLDPAPQIGEPMDMAQFEALGDEGVQALACDSTNVFLDGQAGSEGDIIGNLTRLISEAPRAVAATSFASNVARLRTLAEAASEAGRSIVIVGRAMRRMIEVAVQTGQIDNFPKVVPDEDASSIPPENVFYLVTGSQGEGRAALARIAAGNHPTVSLSAGDLVLFSSKTIPGNEGGIYRLYNRLSEQGIKVIDGDMERIHVSGHARRGDLERIYAALKPRVAVPIHGEHRHLVEHAASAPGWGAAHAIVAPNGSVARLDGNAPGIVEEVETGRVYLDGTAHVGAYDGVIRERLKMARLGVVIVSLVTDEEGELIADPEIRCHGAPKDGPGWSAPLAEMIAHEVDTAMESAPRKAKRTDNGIEEIVMRAVRRVTNRFWGKKPMVSLIIHRLEEG